MASSLSDALKAITWPSNVGEFCADSQRVDRLERAVARFATWATQLESLEHENPAVAFVREARRQTHFAAILTSLALYKPAAGAMRAFLECALYYTYFRSHPLELGTLVRDSSFFLQKQDVLDFHRKHTPDFARRDGIVGLTSQLSPWYSRVSAIVHGQLPGEWLAKGTASNQLAAFDAPLADQVVDTFERGSEIVELLLLCTVAQDLWGSFSLAAKKVLLKGMSGARKAELQLSLA